MMTEKRNNKKFLFTITQYQIKPCIYETLAGDTENRLSVPISESLNPEKKPGKRGTISAIRGKMAPAQVSKSITILHKKQT
jgi:hypothetical protein